MNSGSSLDPDRLLAAARTGDRQALGRLLELYRNYLNLLARTQADLQYRGRLSTSDVVQETVLKAFDRFSQFRGTTEKELLGWLRTILVRVLAQILEREIRAQKRDARREISLDQLMNSLTNSTARFDVALASGISSPSVQAQRREAAAVVADQLAELPEHHREVVVLRNLQGMPFADIATRLGKNESTVRSLWVRALDKLRRMNQPDVSP